MPPFSALTQGFLLLPAASYTFLRRFHLSSGCEALVRVSVTGCLDEGASAFEMSGSWVDDWNGREDGRNQATFSGFLAELKTLRTFFLVFYLQNEVFKALDLTQTKRKVYSKIKSHFKWKIQLFSNKTKWLNFYSLMFIFFQKEPSHQNH